MLPAASAATTARVAVVPRSVPGRESAVVDMATSQPTSLLACQPTSWWYRAGMARDVADTRRKLLDAARDEFARHGSAGARVDRIAAAAGVNKERIYGHFGSKDDLFAAALADSMRDITDELEGGADRDVGDYVAHKLAFHAEHPDTARLVMWETLERADEPIVAEEERRAIYARKVTAFAEMLGVDERE